MTLTIDYTGQLASVVGASEEAVEVAEGDSVADVLKGRLEVYGEKFGELVFDGEGRIRSTLLVVLDGEQAAGDKGNLSLEGVKVLMLMTPIAGG
ncbi:MAG: MoaD/ThiS family protein [Verrucomicrobiota bacterium]